jgi:hypothetical protein
VIRGATIAVAIALAACGGSVASPAVTDGGPPPTSDGASPQDASPSMGCPSVSEINSGVSLGKACDPEGAYCTDLSCDPCRMNCPAVSCTHGVWTTAINTALCVGDAGVGPGVDASVCETLDLSTFNQTCTATSDCVMAQGGTFCSSEPLCLCGGESINVVDQMRYQAELDAIKSSLKLGPSVCSCPFFGKPTCVAGTCVTCGGAAPSHPGCPDGG